MLNLLFAGMTQGNLFALRLSWWDLVAFCFDVSFSGNSESNATSWGVEDPCGEVRFYDKVIIAWRSHPARACRIWANDLESPKFARTNATPMEPSMNSTPSLYDVCASVDPCQRSTLYSCTLAAPFRCEYFVIQREGFRRPLKITSILSRFYYLRDRVFLTWNILKAAG